MIHEVETGRGHSEITKPTSSQSPTTERDGGQLDVIDAGQVQNYWLGIGHS